MSTTDRERWNEKYSQREPVALIEPDGWLVEALAIINDSDGANDSQRQALDVACGLGHNAIWLAQQGWQVDAVDVSHAGLQLARQSATSHGCDVNWIEADLDDWMPQSSAFDLAVVFRFLDRATVPRVVRAAVRTAGWLVYETFSAAQLQRPDSHIRNPAFTLASGELQQLFPEFDVILQREDVLADRTVERFLAQRR